MNQETRTFGAAAITLALLLILICSYFVFLRSPAGLSAFLDEESRLDLTREAKGPLKRKDGLTIIGANGADETTRVRLPPMDLSAGQRYLLVVEADPGRKFVLHGFERLSDTRVKMRIPSRRGTRRYLRVFDYGDLDARLELRLLARGPEQRIIRELALFRISPVRESLLLLLPTLAALAIGTFLWTQGRRLRTALFTPSPVDDAFFALVAFALCLVIFRSAPVQQMMDGKAVTSVSHSLIHEGSLSMGEAPPAGSADLPYWMIPVNGQVYHYSYTSVAILNTPFIWVYERFGISPIFMDGSLDGTAELRILRTISAALAAGVCAVLYFIGRLFLVPWQALVLTGAFAFGTQIHSTISRPYWSHSWALLLMAAGLYLVLSPRSRQRPSYLVGAMVLLALSSVCRPSMLLSAVAVGFLIWRSLGARQRFVFLTSAVVAGLTAALVSRSLLGFVLPPHFWHFIAPLEIGGILRSYPTGLLGSLISPARGLLLYVPLYAWILWSAFRQRRELSSRALGATAAVVILLHWQVLLICRAWSDGQVYGPRLFSDSIVWFFVLAVLVVEAWGRRRPQSGSLRLRAAVFAAALAASIFVNARGAWYRATWHWDWLDRPPAWLTRGGSPTLTPEWVWNWRYPQFMAGLLPHEEGGRDLYDKWELTQEDNQ